MFSFEWLWVLALLPLPLLTRYGLSNVSSQSRALIVPYSLSETESKDTLSTQIPAGKQILLWLIWLCLVLSAARPQWLGEPISVPNEGREMMLAVDLSGSMQNRDMVIKGTEVDRLTMVKYVLKDFIQRRTGDRLGLILFADTAYLQAPLTFDRKTVYTLLNEAVIGLVGKDTAIGDAIGLAVKRFRERETSNNVLILMTDGRNTAGNILPEDAKQLAIEQRVKIYAIGVGSDGASKRLSRRYMASDLDESLLTDLAKSTGGQYFRARNAEELEQIYSMLDQLEPIEGEGQTYRPLHSLFMYPLYCALAFFGVLALTQIHWGRIKHA